MALRLTVSEIAEMLEKPERRSALVERVRHWTREGLIQPIGDKNPGTGRHREYDESALFDVAVLNNLANLSLQVRIHQNVLKLAREIYSNKELMAAYSKKKGSGYGIYITMSAPGIENPIIQELHGDNPLKNHMAAVVMNIGLIFEEITKNIQSLETRKLPRSRLAFSGFRKPTD